jgi:hypothetical protein
MVPAATSVATVPPPLEVTLPAIFSEASGVIGSEPGRSLSSGWMVIALPTWPTTTSGSAVAGCACRSVGACTCTWICSVTGGAMPSVTPYSIVTSPPLAGALNRISPVEVGRAEAPWGPLTTLAEARLSGSPSASSRQSGSTGMVSTPAAGTTHFCGW